MCYRWHWIYQKPYVTPIQSVYFLRDSAAGRWLADALQIWVRSADSPSSCYRRADTRNVEGEIPLITMSGLADHFDIYTYLHQMTWDFWSRNHRSKQCHAVQRSSSSSVHSHHATFTLARLLGQVQPWYGQVDSKTHCSQWTRAMIFRLSLMKATRVVQWIWVYIMAYHLTRAFRRLKNS